MNNVPADIRTELLAGSPPSGVTSANVFLSEPSEDDNRFPAVAVFVWNSFFALPPIPHIGTPIDSSRSILNVRVRGSQGNVAATQTMARAIMEKLHRSEPAGYTFVHLRESDPMNLGLDMAKRPNYQFSLNVRYAE